MTLLRNKVSNNMKNNEIRKLTRLGKRSIGLTLPIEIVRELGWKEKQKVVVKKVRGGFLVKDWKK
jgi:bifunctional DNA-binding transcriptional regulator/antitoxin component of YhaV-PrlF toxin-antitoxin module